LPAMAARISAGRSVSMSRSPRAANRPAVTSRESPGRKKPTISPVSEKMMAMRPYRPAIRMSSGTL